ncbi:hypothetical protein RMCBS344292_15092 [Rhizopus microsporus]|nr:hypothetical protein RMCBS344292_15092 [Rhizopus microsporus]
MLSSNIETIISILTARFKWLKAVLSQSRQKIIFNSFVENQGHHWVTAKMNSADVSFDMYDEAKNAVFSYGPVHEVMSIIKTGRVTLLGCSIRLKKSYSPSEKKSSHFEVSILISSMQVYDISNFASPIINNASVDIIALRLSI